MDSKKIYLTALVPSVTADREYIAYRIAGCGFDALDLSPWGTEASVLTQKLKRDFPGTEFIPPAKAFPIPPGNGWKIMLDKGLDGGIRTFSLIFTSAKKPLPQEVVSHLLSRGFETGVRMIPLESAYNAVMQAEEVK